MRSCLTWPVSRVVRSVVRPVRSTETDRPVCTVGTVGRRSYWVRNSVMTADFSGELVNIKLVSVIPVCEISTIFS